MKEALERVRTELGPNAAILQTRKYKSGGVMGIGGQEMIEVTAAIDDEEPPAKPEPKPQAAPQPAPQPMQQIPKPQPKPVIPALQPKPKPIPTPQPAPQPVEESKPDNYFAGPIVEDEDEDDEVFEAQTNPPPAPQPQPVEESKPVVETQPIPKPRPKISIKVPPKIQIPGQKPQPAQQSQPAQSTQTQTQQTAAPKPVQPIKPQIPKITVPQSKTEAQSKTETPKPASIPSSIAPKKFTIPQKSPVPAADSESKSEVKTESTPEVKSETPKTESKVESKTESKSKRGIEMSETPSDFDLIKEIKPLDETEEDLENPEEVAKIEQTDESKSESKTESKSDDKSKPESKPEEKSDSKVESKDEKSESKSDEKIESKDESKSESKEESKDEIEIKQEEEPLGKEFIGMPLPRFQQLKRFLPPKTPKSIGALPAINVRVISNDPEPPKIESPKIEPAKIAPAKIESKSEDQSKISETPTMPRDDESPIKPEEKIETPLTAEQKRIQELEKELADMKDLLKKFTSEHDSPRKENLTLQDVLESQEIDENLVKEFSERSRQGILLEDNRSDNAKQALSTFIGQIMDFSQGIKLNRNGVRIAALIGPTGVGKTTTLAKIAAKFVLEKNAKTALITADTYRISAVEQIKTYSDILGLPLEIVYSPMELARAIRRHSDKNLILIDTAGRSQFNRDQMRELQDFLKISPYIERHLVLSATTKKRDAADIIEKFSVCNPNRLVLTKTDETSSTGALLDLLREKNIPLSYITHGQSVPDDILPASPDSMADVLLNRINDDAFDTDYKF